MDRWRSMAVLFLVFFVTIDLIYCYENLQTDDLETQFLNVDKNIDDLLKPQHVTMSPVHYDDIQDQSVLQPLAMSSSCSVYDSTFSVSCTFNVTNKGLYDIWILQRNTPLEGILSEFLQIKRTHDQHLLSYEGVMIHRLEVISDEFVLVSAKQTLSVSVVISTVYNFNLPGIYNIQYSTPIKYKDDLGGKKLKTFRPNCVASIKIKERTVLAQHQFVINLIKRYLRHVPSCTPMSYKGVCKPYFIAQHNKRFRLQTTQIHKTVYTYLDPALLTITKDVRHFTKWFGLTSHLKNVQRVKGVFSKIQSSLTRDTFAYAYDGLLCSKMRVLAYTWRGVHAIVLCPLSYRFPSILHPFSQLGTLLHELTHSVGYTRDVTYNIRKCLRMAKHRPDLSVENAASYGYYFTSILPVKYGVDSIGQYGNVMFMTKGPIYLKYTNNRLDCNYPKLIMNHWGANIPVQFHDGFDTMIVLPKGRIAVTKGTLYLLYNSLTDQRPRIGPHITSWSRIPAQFSGGFDTGVYLDHGLTYFTRGNEYIRLSNFPRSLRIDSGYPKSLVGKWSQMSSSFDAITSISNKLCFFKQLKYFCFNAVQRSLVPSNSKNYRPVMKELRDHVGQLRFCM